MTVAKTELGFQVLKDRSVRLTPRQRSMLILFDGKRGDAEVLEASQGQQEDVEALMNLGLIAIQASPRAVAAEPSGSKTATAEGSTRGRGAQERYKAAYPIATQLTAGLGLRGFRLNLAVEAVTTADELAGLLPKIRAAVGPEKVVALERALAP